MTVEALDPDVPSAPSKLHRPHDEGDHLLVFEDGELAYLSVPPLISDSVDDYGKLCFLDHRVDEMEHWDPLSDMCCVREAGHVHAHVHHGDFTEDILLEQCMEEAGCSLPMAWDLGSVRTPVCSGDEHELDHEHQDGCGHNRIAHGDHYDWLIPMKDGSYVLSHAQPTANGGSQFIDHGRLVKVGESLGKLERRRKTLVDVFSYEGPKRKGYEAVPVQEEPRMTDNDDMGVFKSQSTACMAFHPKQEHVHDDNVKLTIPRGFTSAGVTKTTLDVMGICCPSEVPLIKKILAPLPGVEEVLVNPTTKIVTVLHDAAIVPDIQLVKLLNEARLDACIHQRGKRRSTHKWPSPWTMGCGILLLISFLHYAWPPLKWVALASVAIGLPPILARSWVAIRRCVLDINVLMLIAVGGAIALGDYVEAGSIAFLFTLADWLESKSSDKARDAISNVAELAPQTAVLMDGQRVRVEDVIVGTLLAVKAGELVPIDGVVVSGKSSIDESNVTGESKPVEKTIESIVWAGTMNLSGYISIKTTALSEDSAVSRMVRLVEEAQNQHSRTEQLVERLAKYYTPLVVLSAILIAFIPLAVGTQNPKHWFYLALVLLVVACPCALVISTPVTTTCGIAQAARSGLLVRGGSYLEALAKVKVVAMDKTGTLTEGHFRVVDVQSVDSTLSIQQILYWVACVEVKSSHPLAAALVAYARLHGVEPTGDITDFEINPGLGVSAIVDGKTVQIGNARLSSSFIGSEDVNPEIDENWNSQGATVVWVGVNGRQVGVFRVTDALRPEACEAVASLKKLGMTVAILTGDSVAAAEAVRRQIGDIEVHAALLPEDKVRLVKEFKRTGVTAMVGDGINDAPALASADIGIAMGVAGSAVAMETADVALMTNDLKKLAVALKLGKKVRMKIIQNVSLSFLTKVTIIVLAAVGYPTLWAAIVADVGTCLLVIFNSMRLLNRKKGVVLPKFESHKDHHHKGKNPTRCVRQNEFSGHGDGQAQDLCKFGDHHHQKLGKINHESDSIDLNQTHKNEHHGSTLNGLDRGNCCTSPWQDGNSCSRVHQRPQAKKCCSDLDTTVEVQPGYLNLLDDRKCCTIPQKDGDSCVKVQQSPEGKRCCPRVDAIKEVLAGQVFAVDHNTCCTATMKEGNFPTNDNQNVPTKKCCGSDYQKAQVKKCCATNTENVPAKKCCGSEDQKTQVKKCCATNAESAVAKKCCSSNNANAQVKKCCPSNNANAQAKKCCPSISQHAQAKKCCQSNDENVQARKCCSGNDQNTQAKKCCPSIDENVQGKECCPSNDQNAQVKDSCPSGKQSAKTKVCCSRDDQTLSSSKCYPSNDQNVQVRKCCPSGKQSSLTEICFPIENQTVVGKKCCQRDNQDEKAKECCPRDNQNAQGNKCCSSPDAKIEESQQD